MSNVVSKSDPLTSSEITMIENLAALPASGSGQFIQKTGTVTFQNGTPPIQPTSLSILVTTGTINDSNLFFPFASQPSLLVINGGIYMTTGGAITWTWDPILLIATLSSLVGINGSIFGIK